MIKRIFFHANASKSEGSGHVMRMYALAEEAKSRDIETVFIGKILDVPWITHKFLSQVFDAVFENVVDISLDLKDSALIWDSYHLGRDTLQVTSLPFLRKYLVADAVTPIQSVDSVFLLENSPIWDEHLDNTSTPFLKGRHLVPIRKSHQLGKLFKRCLEKSNLHVLLFAGGVEHQSFVPSLSEVILEKFPEVSMTVISTKSDLTLSSRLQIQKPTENIDLLFESADLVISSASSSILEVLARRIPSGFILTAENQISNREYLLSEGLSIEIGALKDGQFFFDLSSLSVLLQDIDTRKSLQNMSAAKFEGIGSSLIIDYVEQNI